LEKILPATTKQRLVVQYTVANILTSATTLAECAPKILEAVGNTLNWDYGGLWISSRKKKALTCVATWQRPNVDLSQFDAFSRQLVFAPGVGFPGKIWATCRPLWLTDLNKASNFPRLQIAITEGLRSGFGFPLRLGDKVLGVIEFFSRKTRLPDEELLQLMGGIGSQIGQFIERKAAEHALRESEERYRLVAETASDAIITINEKSTILFANPAVEKVFGYQREELLGQNLAIIMPEHLRDIHKSSVKRYLDTGEKNIPWRGMELPGLNKDGTVIPLEISFSEFIKDDRHVFTGIIRDISDRKRAEKEREQLLALEHAARTEAEKANRLKDEFLATVSHELRTPLNSILGWASLIRTKQLDEPTSVKALEIIERNANLQNKLISDLLDVSSIITGRLKLNVRLVDLTSIIENAVASMRLAIEAKEIDLKVNSELTAVEFCGDPDRLQQVVWNLLSNAIKFTPNYGRVEIALTQTDSQIQLIVRDTGEGIEHEFFPHMFERFRQADSSITRLNGGLGLGLAIVKHLVELHGGTVRAESPGKGQGATFTVSLPVDTVFLPSETKPPDRVRTGAHEILDKSTLDGLRILVVDDDADSLELTGLALAEYGARIQTAGSARQALKLLDQVEADVLISDIGLPEMNGYDLIRHLRESLPNQGDQITAIALSGYAREEDREKALAAGYSAYLPKPFEPTELITVIASLKSNTLKQ
jgi:PAS domain S-box-containing protein